MDVGDEDVFACIVWPHVFDCLVDFVFGELVKADVCAAAAEECDAVIDCMIAVQVADVVFLAEEVGGEEVMVAWDKKYGFAGCFEVADNIVGVVFLDNVSVEDDEVYVFRDGLCGESFGC